MENVLPWILDDIVRILKFLREVVTEDDELIMTSANKSRVPGQST